MELDDHQHMIVLVLMKENQYTLIFSVKVAIWLNICKDKASMQILW